MNQKIKFLRETSGLTKKEISDFLNISTYKYNSYEKTGFDISFDILVLLSRIYGMNIELLIDSKYDNNNLLAELKQQHIVENDKTEILKRLKQNLFQDDIAVTYHSIRKVKDHIQQIIISNISALIEQSGMTLQDFALFINIDKMSLESVLSGKRFIEVEEIIKISEKTEMPINDIINQ